MVKEVEMVEIGGNVEEKLLVLEIQEMVEMQLLEMLLLVANMIFTELKIATQLGEIYINRV